MHFFYIFLLNNLVVSKKSSTFALAFGKESIFNEIGRIAQLVQSICLTSRGSGVRIPLRPQNS